ncbi:hypothetical protein ACROYT_G018935 [Oculina patagonica]
MLELRRYLAHLPEKLIHLFHEYPRFPFSIMMFANNSSTTNLDEEEFQSHNAQNGTCLLPIDFVAIMISYVTIYSALLIASLVGNTLLIYASLKSNLTMNLVMANIAASDLLFSIVHLPREIVVQIKKSTAFVVHGTIGQLLCKMCAFVADVTIAVSTLSLVLITADRNRGKEGRREGVNSLRPLQLFSELKRELVDEFHSHLNSINPHNIKFTIEVESEGSIAFLDTKTTRQEDGSITVSVYRKATNTDRYLDFTPPSPA